MIAILIIIVFIAYLFYPLYSILDKIDKDEWDKIDCDDDAVMRIIETDDPADDFMLNLLLDHVFTDLNKDFYNPRDKLRRICNVNSSTNSST